MDITAAAQTDNTFQSLATPWEVACLCPSMSENGQFYYLARFVAERLSAVDESLPDGLYLKGHIRRAARYITGRSDPAESPKQLKGASNGIVHDNPIWAILVPDHLRTGPLGGDGLRAIIVADALLRWPATTTNRWRLHKFVKTWDDSTDLTAERDKILLYFGLPNSSNLRRAHGALEAAARLLDIRQDSLEDAQRLLRSLHGDLTRDWEQKVAEDAELTSFKAGIYEGEGVYFSSDTYQVTAHAAPQALAKEDCGVQRREAARSGLLRRRALHPGGDNSLLPQEVIEVIARVRQYLLTGTGHIGPQCLASLIIVLTIVTTRGWRDIYLELYALALGASKWIGRRGGKWGVETVLPAGNKHARENLPADIAAGTVFHVWFAFPDEIQELIEAIASCELDMASWGSAETALREILKGLRQGGVVRASQGRLRMSLAVAITDETDDPCDAMAITGEGFGQSTAPTHYYSSSYERLWTLRKKAIKRISELSVPEFPGEPEGVAIGAPLAAISDSRIKAATTTFLAQVDEASATKNPLVEHNALTIYVARMLMAATAHRGTTSIGKTVLSSFDERGWVVLHDKSDEHGVDVRLCIVPPICIDAIRRLSAYRAKNACHWKAASTHALILANEGKGAFFVLFENDGSLREIGLQDLNASIGLPRNFTRARLRMMLTRHKVAPQLIYEQLGHVWNGFSPFDRRSLESVVDKRRILAPVLESILTEDGWMLPASLRRYKGAMWPVPLRVEDFGRKSKKIYKGIEQQWRVNHKIRNFRFTPEQRGEHEAWVRRQLQTVSHEYEKDKPTQDVTIPETQISHWQVEAAATFTDISRAAAALRSLRARLVNLRKSYGWNGAMLPLVFFTVPELPPILASHVQAAQALEELRNSLVDPATTTGKCGLTDRWARLAGFLIADCWILNQHQLRSCLQAISEGHIANHPDCVHLGLTDIDLGADVLPDLGAIGSDGRRRSIQLGREAYLLALSLIGQKPPKLKDMGKRLSVILKTRCAGIGSSPWVALLDIAQQASRITHPGVLWSAIDRQDPGTLDLQRTDDWVRGGIGARRRSDGPKYAPSEEGFVVNLPPARNFEKRYVQYQELRIALWRLAEPGAADQTIPRWRYKEVQRLCKKQLSCPEGDQVVAMLASFLSALAKPRSARVKTCYGAITSIGRRLIQSLGDASIIDLDGSELLAAYAGVLERSPHAQRATVASNLYRFHRYHQSILAEVNFGQLLSGSGDAVSIPVRTEIVTEGEYIAMRGLAEMLVDNGMLSTIEGRQVRVMLSLEYREALRIGEVTHGRVVDLSRRDRVFVIRNTNLGLVKTDAAVRPCSLWNSPEDELGELYELCEDADKEPLRPLIRVDSTDQLGELLATARTLIRTCSGQQQASLHSLRHSAISAGILKVLMSKSSPRDQMKAMLKAARGWGHAEHTTSFLHYWHLQHLVVRSESVNLTSRQISMLTGRTPAAIRKGASRNGPVTNPTPGRADSASKQEISDWALSVKDGRALEGTHAILKFFVSLHLGVAPALARRSCRLGHEQAAAALRAISDVGQRFQVAVLPSASVRNLGALAPHFTDSIGRNWMRVSPSPVQLKRLRTAKSINLSSDELPSPDLLMTALRRPVAVWTEDERLAAQSISRMVRGNLGIHAVALISLAGTAARRTLRNPA